MVHFPHFSICRTILSKLFGEKNSLTNIKKKKLNQNKTKSQTLGRIQREEGNGVTKKNVTFIFHILELSEVTSDAGLEHFTYINTFMLPEIYFLPNFSLEHLP